jgi:L-malate glycosyltransferase
VKGLRVLYLIDSLGPGGAQRQLTTLVRSLDRSAVKPEVAIYYPFHHFRNELTREGVPIHMLGPGGGRNPAVLFRLMRLLSRGRFDVVHTFLRTPGVLARAASVVAPATKVVVSERSTGLGGHRGRLLLERMLAPRADAFVVNSHAMADEIVGLVPRLRGRLSVVPNGLLWNEPAEREKADAVGFRAEHGAGAEFVLLAVGRIARAKGTDVLIEALEMTDDKALRQSMVLWIGAHVDERLADAVQSRVAAGRLSDRVRFLPVTDDLRSAYLAADALVLPSRREGLPNVLLEALAHGIPAIATDVGDSRRIVEGSQSGWVVPAEDPSALARAIELCLATPSATKREMGGRGSVFVRENYSVTKLVERTMAVYDAVLAGRASS